MHHTSTPRFIHSLPPPLALGPSFFPHICPTFCLLLNTPSLDSPRTFLLEAMQSVSQTHTSALWDTEASLSGLVEKHLLRHANPKQTVSGV